MLEVPTRVRRAGWPWLVIFFAIFTFGELYILPTGLSLFARLAPQGYGATTMAAWFLAIFSGSLCAGVVGALWSQTTHAQFFFILRHILRHLPEIPVSVPKHGTELLNLYRGNVHWLEFQRRDFAFDLADQF